MLGLGHTRKSSHHELPKIPPEMPVVTREFRALAIASIQPGINGRTNVVDSPIALIGRSERWCYNERNNRRAETAHEPFEHTIPQSSALARYDFLEAFEPRPISHSSLCNARHRAYCTGDILSDFTVYSKAELTASQGILRGKTSESRRQLQRKIWTGIVDTGIDILLTGWDTIKIKVLGVCLAAINVVASASFIWDKHIARRGDALWKRLPKSCLLALCLVGGAPDGLIAMRAVRHKTARWHFVWGLPLLLVLDAALTPPPLQSAPCRGAGSALSPS